MPQATNLVVKNGASTPVDKTFTLISPAAGFGGIANWSLKEGAIAAVFPTFTAQAVQLSGGKVNKLTMKLRLPSSYLDSVTGLTNVGSFFGADVVVTVPSTFPEDKKNDAVAFLTNLLNTTLVKEMSRDATPST